MVNAVWKNYVEATWCNVLDLFDSFWCRRLGEWKILGGWDYDGIMAGWWNFFSSLTPRWSLVVPPKRVRCWKWGNAPFRQGDRDFRDDFGQKSQAYFHLCIFISWEIFVYVWIYLEIFGGWYLIHSPIRIANHSQIQIIRVQLPSNIARTWLLQATFWCLDPVYLWVLRWIFVHRWSKWGQLFIPSRDGINKSINGLLRDVSSWRRSTKSSISVELGLQPSLFTSWCTKMGWLKTESMWNPIGRLTW